MSKYEKKDFINIILSCVLYLGLYFIYMLTERSAYFIPLLAVLFPILGGIPVVLYISKLSKWGHLTAIAVAFELTQILNGDYLALLVGIVLATVGEYLMYKGEYKKTKNIVLAYGIMSIMISTPYVQFLTDRKDYYDFMVKHMGIDFTDTVFRIIPAWSVPLYPVITFVAGVLGAYIGIKVFGKQLMKAGYDIK